MRVQITIELGNDAMSNWGHVSALLRKTARRIENTGDTDEPQPGQNYCLKDDNGNTVGHLIIEEA